MHPFFEDDVLLEGGIRGTKPQEQGGNAPSRAHASDGR